MTERGPGLNAPDRPPVPSRRESNHVLVGMKFMTRSIVFRGMFVLVSMTGVILGCSNAPVEGDLPVGRVAEPGEMEKIQEELVAKKMVEGTAPARPPGIQIPLK